MEVTRFKDNRKPQYYAVHPGGLTLAAIMGSQGRYCSTDYFPMLSAVITINLFRVVRQFLVVGWCNIITIIIYPVIN